MSVLNLEAKLERYDSSTPWGFRMQGGKDFNSPLIIQNVNPGSLAAKCGLQVGDVILKIGNTATEYLLHKEAQSSILESGNRLDLLLQRRPLLPTNYQKKNLVGEKLRTPPPQIQPPSNSTPNPPPFPIYADLLHLQNFNNPPRPFGSQAPARSNYESNLSQQTSGLSLSEPNQPLGFPDTGERYTERQDAPNPAQHQSRSFRKLASLIDEDGGNESPAHPLAAQPIGPGSKPGTVKAIISQRYNNPMGLYSNENINNQLQGQSKFLIENDDAASKQNSPPACENTYDEHGRKNYVPSETFRLVQDEVGNSQKVEDVMPVHSRSFKMIQQQLNSYQPTQVPVARATTAKPWALPPAQPQVPRSTAQSSAPPVPTGVGATRGKRGDAAMNPAALPAAGHIPVCVGCHLPIRGPFVTALGKCWCPDHFVCANPRCGIKLQDTGFVEEGGFLYCEQDYAIHFAPHCDRCGQPVVGECVNAAQKSFHPGCFLCTQCRQPISGTKFHIEDGNFYCEADWMAMFQTMCSGCNFPIEPGDKWVEAVGKNFHCECFNCATCQINLEGQQFCAKGGRAYCKKHGN
ncbi:unnamed protein product [Candidula unifasciata]|uniref:PDZ and LIM domain protein Zasp n=1 Tax=Candidula unifasciata TaxID=100452 RepID=A0A8S3YDQ5_9EUPU|nr:unnamed protein product [Candidula unifasciata]